MIKLLTAAEMREIDRATSEVYGLPSIVLMEHAGKAVATAARELLSTDSRHVCVVCGKGNNGGDGLVAARWLLRWGYVPEVFLLCPREELEGDARIHLQFCLKSGVKLEVLTEEQDFVLLTGSLRRCSLVIDALLGTGLQGAPRQPLANAIRQLNNAKRPILSIDVPSGLNADTGEVYDPHVVAQRTVTFGAWKRGLALNPGASRAGKVELVDIGLPEALLHEVERAPLLVEQADVQAMLPRRSAEYHKGDAGRALLVAGSRRLGGAAMLATRAACRGGAGLVTLAAPLCLIDSVRANTPEAMMFALRESEDGAVGASAAEQVLPLLDAASAVGLGPGLGTTEPAMDLLAEVVKAVKVPLVLDADGLNLLANKPDMLDGLSLPLVLTPHPGEAARLLKVDLKRVQSDRLGAAVALSRRFGAVALLKGARTVIATPQGRLLVNPTGCPAMASGGMGDALTGLLVALLAQGLTPADAAVAGAWLHGRAGELAAGGSEAGLLATDLIDALPRARGELRAGQA